MRHEASCDVMFRMRAAHGPLPFPACLPDPNCVAPAPKSVVPGLTRDPESAVEPCGDPGCLGSRFHGGDKGAGAAKRPRPSWSVMRCHVRHAFGEDLPSRSCISRLPCASFRFGPHIPPPICSGTLFRARRPTHVSCPSPPGLFFGPGCRALRRQGKGRLRKPPFLYIPIIVYFSQSQASRRAGCQISPMLREKQTDPEDCLKPRLEAGLETLIPAVVDRNP